jgi:hypothetical protein
MLQARRANARLYNAMRSDRPFEEQADNGYDRSTRSIQALAEMLRLYEMMQITTRRVAPEYWFTDQRELVIRALKYFLEYENEAPTAGDRSGEQRMAIYRSIGRSLAILYRWPLAPSIRWQPAGFGRVMLVRDQW